jgi:purine catabolism regulator
LPLGGGYRWLAVPLAVREGAHLLLALVAPETPATPAIAASGAADATATEARGATLSATLAQVAPLFALTVARQRDLDSSRATLRAETLDALLAGTYPDEDRMRARAAQLGYDLARPHIALVVDLTPQPPSHVGQGEPDSSTTQKQNAASTFPLHSISGASGSFPLVGHRAASGSPPHAGEGLGERFAAALEGAWARVSDGELVALVPVALEATPAESGALAERLRALLAAEPGEWCAGMTEPATGPAALRRAAGAARDTARLGCLVLGPGHVARPADLGIYRLLLRLRETQELADFCRQALGPLLAKGRHAETLLTTLDVFFACNGNFSEAARRLGLHRNSLIYRVKRIRDLLSRDLEDPEERLALQLALKARQVLELRAPG